MQPQGTSVTNPSYISNITAQAQATESCSELQDIATEAMATINAELAAIHDQISALLPLITPPTNLTSCISWITNFQAPLIKPYTNYVAQLTALGAEITSMVSAIEAAAANLTSCSVTIPPPDL